MINHFRIFEGNNDEPEAHILSVATGLSGIATDSIVSVAGEFNSNAALIRSVLSGDEEGGNYREFVLRPPIPKAKLEAFGRQLVSLAADVAERVEFVSSALADEAPSDIPNEELLVA